MRSARNRPGPKKQRLCSFLTVRRRLLNCAPVRGSAAAAPAVARPGLAFPILGSCFAEPGVRGLHPSRARAPGAATAPGGCFVVREGAAVSGQKLGNPAASGESSFDVGKGGVGGPQALLDETTCLAKADVLRGMSHQRDRSPMSGAIAAMIARSSSRAGDYKGASGAATRAERRRRPRTAASLRGRRWCSLLVLSTLVFGARCNLQPCAAGVTRSFGTTKTWVAMQARGREEVLREGPFFDGGWSCQGHGPHAPALFWPLWRAMRCAATIEPRRAETQSGSAAPTARESVTRPAGGGRPNPPRALLQTSEDQRGCAPQRFVSFLRYLRHARPDGSSPVRDP